MLNKDGGVQADVTVSVLEDEGSHDALSPSSDGKMRESGGMMVVVVMVMMVVVVMMMMVVMMVMVLMMMMMVMVMMVMMMVVMMVVMMMMVMMVMVLMMTMMVMVLMMVVVMVMVMMVMIVVMMVVMVMIDDNVDHGVCFSPGRSFYVAVGGGIAEYGWCHIKKTIEDNRFNCQLIDKSEDMGMFSIQGPKR
jgi:hypothetical protein